tara:strand:+ start:588 stop:1346 length:759 start_codon:yes stop_codon:yes gene_type:complete
MPGNEREIIKFLVINKNKINLKHIGALNSIKVPHNNNLIEVNESNIYNFFSDDSHKKADAYLNNIGVSLKQIGGNFSYNRLQRKNISNFFGKFFLKNKAKKVILNIDKKILQMHEGKIKRNFKFLEVMSNIEFKNILYFLMFVGSPNQGVTKFKPKFILETKKKIDTINDIYVYTFDEFFNKYKDKISFAIRRHWIGQKSKSENKRAITIYNNKGNKKWCFNNIRGNPRSGWDDKISEKNRRTVYTLSIEQK